VRQHTILVFLSDNGGSTGTQNNDPQYRGTHPSFSIPARNGILRGKKGQVYEGGIRTPALVSWPGKLPSRDEHSPIHVADWFATFATVAGYRPPHDLKWDGADRWPVLTGAAQPTSRVLYWLGPGANSHALRQGDLVLIGQNGKPDEVYDLAADPSQKHDLAGQRPALVQQLNGVLHKIRQLDNDAKVK
jgi:arylsulfatase A-like enzyme